MPYNINLSLNRLLTNNTPTRKQSVRCYAQIVFGAFVVAVAYVFFITPYKIIPGGVYGLSIVIHYKTAGWLQWFPSGIPIGSMALLFNVPLLILATKAFNIKYIGRTIVTFVATALFVDGLTWLSVRFDVGALAKEDILLSCLYGSAILGFGVALILKARGTSAGTDVLAKILSKRTNIPVGYTIILVDSLIVLLGLIAFGDLKIPMYSLFTVLVYGKMVDLFMQGLSFDKAVFIISEQTDEIAAQIIRTLRRGGTIFHGKGMYNGTEKEIIYTVIDARKTMKLRQLVHQIDPKAFITILDAKEILGEGFAPLAEE
ncbi:MAG: YitT family protein [Prevotellaceae bacterium]|jgi:uncharacterized membrane-anchored protein YitT (DUF2179 family)|nr:YitT family protein [Prevotellaceae bacterium]